MAIETLTWLGIAFCISQSALFSGLNLAFFSLSRLRLESEAKHSNSARRILAMREDSNFLLTTILWGNVGVNVLLTLLSNSVLAGVAAFLFSTFLITFAGEILPQAYFSRHPVKMASLLAPVLRGYQYLFWPVAKPSALILDRWLGKERKQYMRERSLREVLLHHVRSSEGELDAIEGIGALNFLDIDDLLAHEEGQPIDPASMITLPAQIDFPIIPPFGQTSADPFLRKIEASQHKWVILANDEGEPLLVLDADGFLRAALFRDTPPNAYAFCHRPFVIRDEEAVVGEMLLALTRKRLSDEHDDVIDDDVVLIWTADHRRIITGADILGRLLRGIDADDHEEEAGT